MSIISALLISLGVITFLIGVFAYKKRALIMEALYVRVNAKQALKELEQNMYMDAYKQVLKEELPKTMQEKARRDIQKKYNRTPLVDKLAKMADSAQREALKRQNSNHKSGFEKIIDDMNVFNKTKFNENSRDVLFNE